MYSDLPKCLVKKKKRLSCLFAAVCFTFYILHTFKVSDFEEERLSWFAQNRNAGIYLRPTDVTTLLHPRGTCPNNIKLLLMVASAPSHTDQRIAVRQTWGSATSEGQVLFFLGRYDEDNAISKEVLDESSLYGDIIVEDFIDHYDNLSLKTGFMLKWVLKWCPEVPYIMKTDDDMLINVKGILKYLEDFADPTEPYLIGGAIVNASPYRSPVSKWYLPEWLYECSKLPNFLSGTGYIMSRSVVPFLFQGVLSTPIINLEDVYVTGIIANEKLSIPLIGSDRFINYRPRFIEPCSHHRLLTIHGFNPSELPTFWKKFKDLDLSYCKSLSAKVIRCIFGSRCSLRGLEQW